MIHSRGGFFLAYRRVSESVVTGASLLYPLLKCSSMATTSSTARVREFRRCLAERGQASVTLTLDDATSALLRDLAKKNGPPIGAIIRAGALMVRRELERREGVAA